MRHCAGATEIRTVADGAVIAEHALRFGRDQLICDPRHYLPILRRKPNVLCAKGSLTQ